MLFGIQKGHILDIQSTSQVIGDKLELSLLSYGQAATDT